ncbi:MAG: NAD-dependent epimerase/dehydratase family protein [Pseudomonadales bacterium]|nr:NAD-dependent epimerase/dehydratase family protein [Pseudomonadales bacterium]NRA14002.1 NAD-dependent epimerase/dehydratase family protein [Oceanospirillaceae bacterium]
MKFLVTGGCGFIGFHLCEKLISQNHQVLVLDNLSSGFKRNLAPGAELIVADVTDSRVVSEMMVNVDGCFHLAAIASVERSTSDWVGSHKVNQQGSVNVFEAARACEQHPAIPVVYASSAAIYGDNASIPLQESSQPRPVSAYGADKLGTELHARVAWLVHRVPTVGLRFFNVYGPRQNPDSPYSGVISIFIDRILQGLPITIFGDGQQTRDFVYVADVVNYLTITMQSLRTKGDIFNVCTGKSTSILQLAKTLSMIAREQLQIDYAKARSGDIATSLGDPKKAQLLMGLSTGTSLGKGLSATMQSEGLKL